MTLRSECPVCGGQFFHHLGCRVLERYLAMAAALVGIATLVLLVWWIAGGPPANFLLGVGLTGFFTCYAALSRRVRRTRSMS
jgi:hypothetical protein